MKKLTSLLLAILILLCAFTACDSDYEEIAWNNIKLGHMLLEPQSLEMEVKTNNDEELQVHIHNISENQFLEYQQWCESDCGYSIEKTVVGTKFYAYNSEGYYLSLSFSDYGYDQEMRISLKAPIPMEEFELPEFATTAGLPVPESNIGHFNWQKDDSFYLYVGKTVKDAYVLYKDACIAAGFTIDPYEYETVYSATNADGYKISLNYVGFDVFSLEFHNPEEIASDNTEYPATDYALDYSDAESFEEALNDGEKVNSKIVQFSVSEYKPDSILGFSCWSGEHLNFISENAIDSKKGDIIIGRITEEPTTVLGSWKVPYEPLVVNGKKVESNTNNPSTPEPTTNPQPAEITITMGKDDFKGMDYKEAEKIFREMGFTTFEYSIISTKIESDANTISYIEITEWIFGDSDFAKGDKFATDSTVTFFYYEYKAPSPVFYSTNDYETAKNGNTGAFSYKNKSGSYDVYWIIDFDEGFVYFFTEGNGEDYCDKVKLTSGTLNDRVTVTWNLDGEKTDWYLHFKYVNSPVTLIVNDHLGITTEFTTTDLDDALALRDNKKIQNS